MSIAQSATTFIRVLTGIDDIVDLYGVTDSFFEIEVGARFQSLDTYEVVQVERVDAQNVYVVGRADPIEIEDFSIDFQPFVGTAPWQLLAYKNIPSKCSRIFLTE